MPEEPLHLVGRHFYCTTFVPWCVAGDPVELVSNWLALCGGAIVTPLSWCAAWVAVVLHGIPAALPLFFGIWAAVDWRSSHASLSSSGILCAVCLFPSYPLWMVCCGSSVLCGHEPIGLGAWTSRVSLTAFWWSVNRIDSFPGRLCSFPLGSLSGILCDACVAHR